MATITIDMKYTERTAEAGPSGRVVTYKWEALTDDPATTTQIDIVEAAGAIMGLYRGVPLPEWPWATCELIRADGADDDHPGLWTLSATFREPPAVPGTLAGGGGVSPPPPPPPPPGSPPSPENRAPDYQIAFQKEPSYPIQDRDGNFFLNTIGDPLEGLPPVHVGRALVPATTYRSSLSLFAACGWFDLVNSDVWNGFPIYSLKIETVSAKLVTIGTWVGWKVEIGLLFNPELWIPTKVLNTGRRAYRRRDDWSLTGDVVPVADGIGNPSSVPLLLNPDGSQWDIAHDGPAPPDPTEYRLFDAVSFAGI